MPREMQYFDGTSWTTTKVAPTRVAPFAGTRWTDTRVAPTRNAPFAGMGAVAPNPSKNAGVMLGYKVMGSRPATAEEISAVVRPLAEAHRLEMVGKPEYVVDSSPVWVWRAEPNEYGGGQTWTAVVGTGPFKGNTGAVQPSYTPPTLADTLELPQAIGSWVAEFKPISLEDPESLRAQIAEASRAPQFRGMLQKVMGDPLGVSPIQMRSKVIELKKSGGAAKALTSAALIGVALTMLSFREKF